jgi:nucleoside-diphosphate-sugar epimerase
MPQVLITGGAGFIGSHVADHLEPEVAFAKGLEELVEWLTDTTAIDRVDQVTEELARRGLVA